MSEGLSDLGLQSCMVLTCGIRLRDQLDEFIRDLSMVTTIPRNLAGILRATAGGWDGSLRVCDERMSCMQGRKIQDYTSDW